MLSTSYSAAIFGVQARLVTVEALVSMGLPSLVMVGQASGAVYEGRERVKSALSRCGQPIPPRKQVVNLAPAQIRKDSPGLDLSVAMALLAAHQVIDASFLEDAMFWAELGLDGKLRPAAGSLLVADLAKEQGKRRLFVAPASAREATLIPGVEVYAPTGLAQLVDHARGQSSLTPVEPVLDQREAQESLETLDMQDIRGLTLPRLGLETMVAGGHNLLMWGPPGVGKTMLARRARGLFPPLDEQAAIERTKIHSVARAGAVLNLDRRVPFRCPHHTVSSSGLLGGGRPVRPGEVSLAHRGLLFLDELPEFSRRCIEGLREPLEEGAVHVVRADASYHFPAKFQLIAAMNPCHCGYFGHPERACVCSASSVTRYQQKVSGPFVDRMDLVLPLCAPSKDAAPAPSSQSSAVLRERIAQAKLRQKARFAGEAWASNAELPAQEGLLDRYCPLLPGAKALLASAARKQGLSLRAQHRVRKVALTLCDLRPDLLQKERVSESAIALALQLRKPLRAF